jgi:polyphosphate kinase
VIRQSGEFDRIYQDILTRLAMENIILVNEHQLNSEQERFVASYFDQEVRPALIPIMFENIRRFPPLKDHAIYLAVRMTKDGDDAKPHHSLIEVPTDTLPRFVVLPPNNGGAVRRLDDQAHPRRRDRS